MTDEKEKRLIRAHCFSCDWDGYTDDLDDACYICGEYESLKRVADDDEIKAMFD